MKVRVHHHNTSPAKDIAAESSVHVVARDTVTLDADDFTLPEFEPEPELELEFEGVVVLLVPELELLPETVTSPEISRKRKGGYGYFTDGRWPVPHKGRSCGVMTLTLFERG